MPISEDEYETGPMHHVSSYGTNQNHYHAMSKAEQRRSNKPIMEKRRRARINHCLNELKTLILEAMKKDPARHSKLEKADILEMTVKHLQTIQRQQLSSAITGDPLVIHKFKNGFNECATEVSRYIDHMEGIETGVKQRLVSHLANCVNGIQPPLNTSSSSNSFASNVFNNTNRSNVNQHPLSPEDLNNNHSASNRLQSMMNGLQLIPSRLPTGELALLLPNSQQLSNNIFFQQQSNTSIPSQHDETYNPSEPYTQSQITPTIKPETTHQVINNNERTHISAFTAVSRRKLNQYPTINLTNSPQPSPTSSIASTTSYDESPRIIINDKSSTRTVSCEASPNTSGISSELSTSAELPLHHNTSKPKNIILPNKLNTPPVLAVKPLSLMKDNSNNLLLKPAIPQYNQQINDRRDTFNDNINNIHNNNNNTNIILQKTSTNSLQVPLTVITNDNLTNTIINSDNMRYENPAIDYSMKKDSEVYLKRKRIMNDNDENNDVVFTPKMIKLSQPVTYENNNLNVYNNNNDSFESVTNQFTVDSQSEIQGSQFGNDVEDVNSNVSSCSNTTSGDMWRPW